MRQRRVITQLAVFVSRNVVDLTDSREQLGLLDRINAQICLKVQIQSEHVLRVASLLTYQSEYPLFYRIGLRRRHLRSGRRGLNNGSGDL